MAAARSVRIGLQIDPDRFAALIDRALPLVTPADGASLLYQRDPARAAVLQREADRQAVAARYRGGVPEALIGVVRAHGEQVLEGVKAEYVDVVAPRVLAAGAAERIDGVTTALGLGPALQAETALAVIDAAIAQGLPEEVAVGEGVGGALAALDLYTRPVWPAEIDAWNAHHAGVTVGVGVTLQDGSDGGVVVDWPALEGPAWRAGVHQGDAVMSVAGQAVAALPPPRAQAAAALLAGEAGTEVALVVQRGERTLQWTLQRSEVPVDTVLGLRRGPDNGWTVWVEPGIAYVRISAFRPGTDEAFDALLADAQPRCVVLDVRGNGGGDVMAAVNVADRFVADGILAHLVGRTIAPPESTETLAAWNVALPGNALEGTPVVVLVDRDTASAAELLAGALRERAGAVLVGERTVGKGYSQGLRSEGEVAWQVTTGAWTLPSGVRIEAPGGLQVDRAVRLSPAERFQVAEMVRAREALVVHGDGTPFRARGDSGRPELPRLSADPQLAEATRSCRRR